MSDTPESGDIGRDEFETNPVQYPEQFTDPRASLQQPKFQRRTTTISHLSQEVKANVVSDTPKSRDIGRDEFDTNTEQSPEQFTDSRASLLRPKFQRRASMISQLVHVADTIQEAETNKRFHFGKYARFNAFFSLLPIAISLWYAIAIMFPPETREKLSFFLWTDGALATNRDGRATICPDLRESICSEGAFQIVMIFISRTTAFASYTVMGTTFVSKMHCSNGWLSTTHISTIIPYEKFHKIHHRRGMLYLILALLHVVGHYIRWFIRHEVIHMTNTKVGLSGVIGILSMLFVVFSMSSFAKDMATFETRFNIHYFFIFLAAALCFHTSRCRNITLFFFGLWSLDYLYGYFFKTYRLDVVEFSALPNLSGVQMLWRNPKGFQATSGEYVKIKLPWLSQGGDEWHAFSIYLREATAEGLTNVITKEKEKGKEKEKPGRIFLGDHSLGGKEVNRNKTALLLIEFQNEFASPGGKLHDSVKSEMDRTDMVKNAVTLAAVARSVGAHVFHLPLILKKDGSDNPNQNLGILNNVRDKKLFVANTWNAKIIDELMPQAKDKIVSGKNGLDSFPGSNLEELLIERGIETVIIGGFLTNCSVESTMRTAYEKGFNVITLKDGTASMSEAEHQAATEGTFKMFSIPLTCMQTAKVLQGTMPLNCDNSLSRRTTMSNLSRFESETQGSIEEFTESVLLKENKLDKMFGTLITEEARHDNRALYETTQVFISPAGDWTKRVAEEISVQDQLRSCWVRGPYKSPYSIAASFNHIILVASGIGITPALGVMGQYPGSSRTKFLVWSTREPEMVKFFAPLLKDAHVVLIFYTGKNYVFTEDELIGLRSYGNIYIDQKRPKSLTGVIESLILTFENQSRVCRHTTFQTVPQALIRQLTIQGLDKETLAAWCVLYCGGSARIQKALDTYADQIGIKFDSEKFDW